MIFIKKLTFLFLLMAVLTVSCKKVDTAASPDQSTNAETTVHPKIVFVNIDTLLAKYDLYNEKKKELEGQSAAAEKNLSVKVDAFQKRVAKFQQEVYETQQKSQNIAPVELQKLEQQFSQRQQALANEESALGKQRDEAAADLDKKLTDLQVKLKDNIDNYLVKIAAERGYDYILSKGLGQSVLFGNDKLDITEEAIKTINEEYTASKETK